MNTKEKNRILFALKTLQESCLADTENYDLTSEEFWKEYVVETIGLYLALSTTAGIQESPGFAGSVMKEISDSTYRLLSTHHKELSNLLPAVIEGKKSSSLIYHAVLDGITTYMWLWKQSKTGWCSMHGITRPLETFTE